MWFSCVFYYLSVLEKVMIIYDVVVWKCEESGVILQKVVFYLSITIMLFVTSCGKNPSNEVSFALPDIDTNTEFRNLVKEEMTTGKMEEVTAELETIQQETTSERVINILYQEEIEQLIERYNEAEQLFNGVLPVEYTSSTIHSGEHKWSLRLQYSEYNTLAGMDAYWRQYFTQQFYDEEYGVTRVNAFFEYDGDLCMQGITGFPDRIIFESVSDWVETDKGIEACFDISKNRCTEFINDEEHFDRIRITFVWENDILKIDKILNLEKTPQ